jgi:2-oxo-4-hydroxy-4-carboxy-5-ureidoimidazoline decarboxylase
LEQAKSQLQALLEINQLSLDQAQSKFMECCGSTLWCQEMSRARPFTTLEALYKTAEQKSKSLATPDWLEAFSHHPRIGDRRRLHPWASEEQKGVKSTSSATLAELDELNVRYESKFGFVFLICATNKTAEEMLGQLKIRIQNTVDVELKIAAEEQIKITKLRLEKLLRS